MKNRLYTSFVISMILMLALSACAALATPAPATETPKPTAAPTTPPLPTKPPAPVLTAALFQRFSSRGEADFADRLQSAMRYQFGGHEEKPVRKGA